MIKMMRKRHLNIYLFMILISAILILISVTGCNERLTKIRPLTGSKIEKLRPKAIEIIESGLADTDPKIQTKAIEAVAASKQKQMMPQVQKLLFSDYIPVRFAAALAIGDTKYYIAKNQLSKLLNAPDDNTKIAASYALYKLGHKQYLDVVKKAVKSFDQTVRANAVVLLGKSGEKSSLDLLYWAKDDEDSEKRVRYLAVEAIANLGDEKIIEKIWTLLISKFVDNQIIGIRAMGAIGTRNAKDALITKLEDEVVEVRLAAAEQLGVLGDDSGKLQVAEVFDEKLTSGLESEDVERIFVLATLAIGSIDSEELTKYLPKMVDYQSKQVRIAAAQAVLKNKIK